MEMELITSLQGGWNVGSQESGYVHSEVVIMNEKIVVSKNKPRVRIRYHIWIRSGEDNNMLTPVASFDKKDLL